MLNRTGVCPVGKQYVHSGTDANRPEHPSAPIGERVSGQERESMDLWDLSHCQLCPRRCGADRYHKTGLCGAGALPRVARAALHFWEEPPISGTRGAGTVFFSGCPLGCVYCQNAAIAHRACGEELSVSRLAELFCSLQRQGAHNIDLVTPGHYADSVKEALLLANRNGLTVPVVFNTSGYERVGTLRRLEGLIQIYLTDMRYFRPESAARYSHAPDYPAVALSAVTEMVRQTGPCRFDGEGILQQGCIIRLLLLPGQLMETKLALLHLYRTFGETVWFSLMSQYTPMPGVPAPLDRPVRAAEYRSLVNYAASLGIRQAFVQDSSSATTAFIPDFNSTQL